MQKLKRIYLEYLRELGEPFDDNPPAFITPYGVWDVDFYSEKFGGFIRLGERKPEDTDYLKWIMMTQPNTLVLFISLAHIEQIGVDLYFGRLAREDTQQDHTVRAMLRQVETDENLNS